MGARSTARPLVNASIAPVAEIPTETPGMGLENADPISLGL